MTPLQKLREDIDRKLAELDELVAFYKLQKEAENVVESKKVSLAKTQNKTP